MTKEKAIKILKNDGIVPHSKFENRFTILNRKESVCKHSLDFILELINDKKKHEEYKYSEKEYLLTIMNIYKYENQFDETGRELTNEELGVGYVTAPYLELVVKPAISMDNMTMLRLKE